MAAHLDTYAPFYPFNIIDGVSDENQPMILYMALRMKAALSAYVENPLSDDEYFLPRFRAEVVCILLQICGPPSDRCFKGGRLGSGRDFGPIGLHPSYSAPGPLNGGMLQTLHAGCQDIRQRGLETPA